MDTTHQLCDSSLPQPNPVSLLDAVQGLYCWGNQVVNAVDPVSVGDQHSQNQTMEQGTKPHLPNEQNL